MTAPTREQVIQAAPPEAYTAEDRAFHAFFYSHMRDEVMQPPLHEIGYVTARYIYAAARAQALDEAAGVCNKEANNWDYDQGLVVAAKAIQALKGKQ